MLEVNPIPFAAQIAFSWSLFSAILALGVGGYSFHNFLTTPNPYTRVIYGASCILFAGAFVIAGRMAVFSWGLL
jgi:hypothetical protein